MSVGIERGEMKLEEKKMKESKDVGFLDYQQLYLHRWDTNFLLQVYFKYICYYLITCVCLPCYYKILILMTKNLYYIKLNINWSS